MDAGTPSSRRYWSDDADRPETGIEQSEFLGMDAFGLSKDAVLSTNATSADPAAKSERLLRTSLRSVRTAPSHRRPAPTRSCAASCCSPTSSRVRSRGAIAALAAGLGVEPASRSSRWRSASAGRCSPTSAACTRSTTCAPGRAASATRRGSPSPRCSSPGRSSALLTALDAGAPVVGALCAARHDRRRRRARPRRRARRPAPLARAARSAR